ncbi:isochorismatase family cysteine hydrolase [Tetragenococcus koreensis]|uniref:isochorismatase family cysteine hydrolase n=1 Tax=Tetragenococcus koreensis TaxID=290335 RepID=UPI000F50E4BF|nr:isochorismatase family cysteine hydrolase [Tetragenococcus koreensis]AYW45092.1 isochorismatase [Tetragenococcus koreensis]GEN90817.1 isochorismatase [Tetragenococcus koreensis]
MLLIIDMQNQLLDLSYESYNINIYQLLPKIAQRLKKARLENEPVIFTKDIPIEYANSEQANHSKFKLLPDLKPLPNELVIIKHSYSMSPENLLQIKNKYKPQSEKIELVGVETNLCILANTITLQSTFPTSKFVIDTALISGREHEITALNLLLDFKVRIKR